MHIAIVGMGALGTLFARKLMHESDVIAIERDSSPAFVAACEAVLVLVKAYDTRNAMRPLRSHLKEATVVVTLQNGLDNAAEIEAATGRRAFAGVTTESATLAGDAIVRGGKGITTLPDDPRLDAFAGTLAMAGFEIARTGDIVRAMWQKLVANAAINPVTALAGVTNGALLGDPALRERAVSIARETAVVASAEGVTLDSEPAVIVETVARASAANRSSMLQDLEAGRRTEADAILNAVLTRAERRGIDVPELRRTYAEIRARGPHL